MDAIIKNLFDFIPEGLRPYAALGLLILYVVTKARSGSKSKQIQRLVVIVRPKPKEGERSLGHQTSLWSRVVDTIF